MKQYIKPQVEVMNSEVEVSILAGSLPTGSDSTSENLAPSFNGFIFDDDEEEEEE